MSIKGKHPTLLKVQYVRPDRKKGIKECFQVLYMDDKGEVHYTEEPPMADIYIVKPEFRTYTYNKPQERIDHMDKITCKVSDIRVTIGRAAGHWGESILDKAFSQKNMNIANQLYAWPYCYGCDFQPEYYFMKQWYDKYPLQKPHLTKAYLDIEVDMMDYMVDMDHVSETAWAPVNCATVIIEETKEVFTFVLKPYKPPKLGTSEQQKKRYELYESQLKQYNDIISDVDGFIKELHDSFDATYGELDYHLRRYDVEIDLIADIFNLINTRKPNFCLIWNMRFDIQYLISRIQVLGYDPTSIVCSPEIPNPRAYFKADRSTWQIEKQYDYFNVTSFTQYQCQMRNFGGIRKSQHKLRSLSLNAIGDRELGDKKVDYAEYGNIVQFPYENFRRFILYNIKDVLLQLGIERKTNDMLTIWNRSNANITPYNKIFRETHLLRNVREKYFEKEGWVQGNNLNTLKVPEEDVTAKKFYGFVSEEDDDPNAQVEKKASFKGAINAEPTMNDMVGELIMGLKTNNVFINCMDFDMGAFYPTCKIISNMDPATLLYKASFDNEEFKSGQFLNRSQNQTYQEVDKNGDVRKNDFTGEAVHAYCSGNVALLGFAYMGIPSVVEVYEQIKQEMKH